MSERTLVWLHNANQNTEYTLLENTNGVFYEFFPAKLHFSCDIDKITFQLLFTFNSSVQYKN